MNLPIFLSDKQAASLEQKERLLMINIGKTSPFANLPTSDPWTIDDDILGLTPYALWFGMTQVTSSLQQQYIAGIEIVEWVIYRIENPFSVISEELIPEKFRRYIQAFAAHEERLKEISKRAKIFLINGQFLAACQISEDARTLSAQYKTLPLNRVDYSVVYNPEWGRMSIGANSLGSMPPASSAMLVWQNLEAARKLYAQTGRVYLPVTLNLDVLTAAMLAQHFDVPFTWLKYVEALKQGNFSSRWNKRLPDLVSVGKKLSELDSTKGTWGGSPTFQGSARGERTSISSLLTVLAVMAEKFPPVEGIEPLLAIRQ